MVPVLNVHFKIATFLSIFKRGTLYGEQSVPIRSCLWSDRNKWDFDTHRLRKMT